MGAIPAKKIGLSLVMPVYNEEGAVVQTIKELQQLSQEIQTHDIEIICVNDGSTDKTGELLAQQSGITVVTHPMNRGYGAALHTGIAASSCDYIAIVDSDGTYPIEEFKRLLPYTLLDFDMVVGARTGSGITSNVFRQLARWVLRRIVWSLTSVMVPDLNSGMRIFRKELYNRFKHLLPVGFSFTTTITVSALYAGFSVHYLNIRYDIRHGKSHIKPVRDFIAFVMLIIRMTSYFEPLRFFVPISMALLGLGFARGVRDVWVDNYLGGASLVLFVASLQVFLTGILADLLVRRTHGASDRTTRSVRERKNLVTQMQPIEDSF